MNMYVPILHIFHNPHILNGFPEFRVNFYPQFLGLDPQQEESSEAVSVVPPHEWQHLHSQVQSVSNFVSCSSDLLLNFSMRNSWRDAGHNAHFQQGILVRLLNNPESWLAQGTTAQGILISSAPNVDSVQYTWNLPCIPCPCFQLPVGCHTIQSFEELGVNPINYLYSLFAFTIPRLLHTWPSTNIHSYPVWSNLGSSWKNSHVKNANIIVVSGY